MTTATLTREPLAAWLNLLQARTVVSDAVEARLQDAHGLSMAELEVLLRLHGEPERRLKMHELADLLLLTPSGITRLTNRLVARGLLKRDVLPEDRRVVFACLTQAGERMVADAFPVFDRAVTDAFAAHLSASELASLRRMLRKILAGNGAWEDQRCATAVAS